MRPSNKQRSRNKPGNNGHNQRRNIGNIINRVFESAGPDGKVRGTPQQIIDKYQALARDAQVAGDRVAAESFLQHSEHYSRLLGEAQRQQMENRFQGQPEREDGQRGPEGHEQPRPPMQEPSTAPGLTTIDPEDSFEFDRGPVETPESRRQPAEEPAPMPEIAPAAANGSDHPAVADAGPRDAPEQGKRQRPRRRPRHDQPEPTPAQPD